MNDEIMRMELLREHSRLVNAGDVDGLMALYAGEATVEDPVGSGPRAGRDALREHFETIAAANPTEVAGDPVAGQDGLHALMPVTAVMDYRPRGPGFAERGWLTLPEAPGPEPERLECEYVHMIRAGSDGLIRESKAFWGRSDIGVLTASPPPGLRAEGAPVDEASGKAGALAYARLMNAGDVDGILDMFTDDVVFEDPVGTEPIRGMDELRSHIAWSISCGTYERPDRVVSSVDGRWVVVPTTVVVHHPLKITFRIIGVNERADDGRTRHARAFWGVSNTKVGDGRDRTGLEHVLTVVDALRQMRNPDRDPGGDRASPA